MSIYCKISPAGRDDIFLFLETVAYRNYGLKKHDWFHFSCCLSLFLLASIGMYSAMNNAGSTLVRFR